MIKNLRQHKQCRVDFSMRRHETRPMLWYWQEFDDIFIGCYYASPSCVLIQRFASVGDRNRNETAHSLESFVVSRQTGTPDILTLDNVPSAWKLIKIEYHETESRFLKYTVVIRVTRSAHVQPYTDHIQSYLRKSTVTTARHLEDLGSIVKVTSLGRG